MGWPVALSLRLSFMHKYQIMSHGANWNARYQDAGDNYLFGTEPNRFLARRSSLFAKSAAKVLSIADGEGRNSVWLAEQGLDVTAIEISEVAVAKAQKLANGRNASLTFLLGDILAADWPPEHLTNGFDWVIGIFIQFADPVERKQQFAAMKRATRPGGRILLQGYTPKQLQYRTGGPAVVENLYTAELLQDLFADWIIEEIVDYEDDIAEGLGHKGRSALIGLVARRPD